MDYKILIAVTIVAVILNLVLPQVVKPLATPDQITPPNGADKLNMWDQIMHMLVHHAQVPVSSSLIIALIVILSYVIASLLVSYL